MNRTPRPALATLAASFVLLLHYPVYANTGPGAEGHPLAVLNGTGDGTYRLGERVPLAAQAPAGYQFVRWYKIDGAAKFDDINDPNTTLTMRDRNTTVAAAFAKIKAWFPIAGEEPANQQNPTCLLLPKNPSASEQTRFEHKVRVTVHVGEAEGDLAPSRVWGDLSVTLGWFPTQELEGIWHSNELLTYWDARSKGNGLAWNKSLPRELFRQRGNDTYEASVWYEGKWTLDQLASKTDGEGNTRLPRALAGFKLRRLANNGGHTLDSTQGKPQDKTEEAKPYGFWLNDDDDRNDKDAVGSSHKDSDDGTINSRRDLEDFARLNIFVGGLHEAITSGQIKVGLKWKDTGRTSPRVKVWRNLATDGGIEYLTDDAVAQQHMALGNPGDVQGSTPYIIPTQFWVDSGLSESQPNGYLLFEGVSEGKGQLVVTLHKADGSEIGEGPGVWLDLKNVKKMYVRAKGTPEDGIDPPFESYFSQPNPPPTGYVDDPNGHPFQQPHDEADSLIVLVHGIHPPFTASPDAYKGNIVAAEIVFKRLWHQGFKGRFAFYKWPALNPAGFGSTGFKFNESEYLAWKYGRGLAVFVNSINKGSKNLFSHSQGNIVCGAALTDYGLSVDNYVLTQAAVPAGCYDTSGGQSDPASINGYPRFWNREASKPTPDFASDLGYRGYLLNLNVSGNVRNFHNQFDFALVTGRWPINNPPFPEVHWEANQDSYKPDSSLSNQNYYTYLPANPQGQRGYLGDAFFVGRFVTDPYESMAMIARPRSKAVGALGATRGEIGSDYDLSVLRNTSGELTFTRSDDDHGAQVGRRVQEVWDYYTELGDAFGVLPPR